MSELPEWLDAWLTDLSAIVPILALVAIALILFGILADIIYNFPKKEEDDNGEA